MAQHLQVMSLAANFRRHTRKEIRKSPRSRSSQQPPEPGELCTQGTVNSDFTCRAVDSYSTYGESFTMRTFALLLTSCLLFTHTSADAQDFLRPPYMYAPTGFSPSQRFTPGIPAEPCFGGRCGTLMPGGYGTIAPPLVIAPSNGCFGGYCPRPTDWGTPRPGCQHGSCNTVQFSRPPMGLWNRPVGPVWHTAPSTIPQYYSPPVYSPVRSGTGDIQLNVSSTSPQHLPLGSLHRGSQPVENSPYYQ